ncbi:hypothetical protein [Glycomyces buryatensis]|uniref:Uncharacterized protein n=1 Tax=Glycomyces buryatensis TaxID=2570927 RepID=A0A4S8QL35_9ACTN|nr:hypothetical protein [Glycomyces buryatensis]THV41434.1 hypothetical protein FAB82_11590 [Glycomyces buryatensis]
MTWITMTTAVLLSPIAIGSTSAAEPPGTYVDAVLATGGKQCEAVDVPVTAAPPATLTIPADAVELECTSSIRYTFDSDAELTFDDAAGTASAASIRIVGTWFGVSCTYEATDLSLERQGDTREYLGGPYTAGKASGMFLCPRDVKLDSAAITFHQ